MFNPLLKLGEREENLRIRGISILLFDLKVESKCGASQRQRVIVSSDSEKFHVFGGNVLLEKKEGEKKQRRLLRLLLVKIFHRSFRIFFPFSFSLSLRDSFVIFSNRSIAVIDGN